MYQLQVANNDLIKHKPEEIKILEKKPKYYRKKIIANKAKKCTFAFNESSLKTDTNLIKEKATIDKNKIRFDCLMKIIEKLKIELNSDCSALEHIVTVQAGKLKPSVKLIKY